ncbi:MAG: phosphatase PAP2 family protein [Methylocystaceae bacterium]
MRKTDRLLFLSVLGWLIFLNIGWLHKLPIFNLMPAPGETIIRAAKWVTHLGDPITLIYASILVVFYLAFWKRSWLLAGIMALNMLVGWLLMDLFKSWWAIPRPVGKHLVLVTDYTYPSGHAMLSLAFYWFLAWLLLKSGKHKGWAVILGVIPLLVGISRPLLNVHFPADVVGGWAAGLGWLTLMIWLYYQIVQRKEKEGRP